MKLRLERFTSSTQTNESIESSWDVVVATLTSIASEWSATLRIERDETDQLFLSASNGRYAVMMQRGDDFFDLVGDPGQSGQTDFVHGGQPAQHPSRFTVSLPLALAAAKEFLELAKADALTWERQEAHEIP